MTRAADPLQSAGGRTRRLDKQDQINAAHVDPEFERTGGHDAAQAASLQRVLDLPTPFVGDAPVVGARQRLAAIGSFVGLCVAGIRAVASSVIQLVQTLGQPFAEGTAVDEDDRRAVAPNRFQDAREDGRPQAGGLPATRPASAVGQRLGGGRWRLHVGHRHDDLEVHVRRLGGVDDFHRPVAAEKPGRQVHWPHCRREADPLRVRAVRQLGEALQRQRQVGAALGRRHRMNLVDDHRLDRPQVGRRPRTEDEEERLGRRHEDLAGLPQLAAAVGGRTYRPSERRR